VGLEDIATRVEEGLDGGLPNVVVHLLCLAVPSGTIGLGLPVPCPMLIADTVEEVAARQSCRVRRPAEVLGLVRAGHAVDDQYYVDPVGSTSTTSSIC
jgi:hypothetical protein